MIEPTPDTEYLRWIAYGFLLSTITAIVRTLADRRDNCRGTILESALCGLISVTVGSALWALHQHPAWCLFAGGAVGGVGSMLVRRAARKYVKRRSEDMTP
jgi:lambda family phage holin